MIRLATEFDLDEIMKIIKEIQKEMKEDHNPQWNEEDDYPNREKFLEDISNNSLYVYEDKCIKGFMTIKKDDGEYSELVNDTHKPALILHRLAIKKSYRKDGLAKNFFKYAENIAYKNNIKILKADTEEHNIKMHNLFNKIGFIKKDEFEYDDYPGHYIYYEKEIN